MPEKVTREEKQVEMAILKAKEIIQEAKHLGILELDEPALGEDFKVKRPKKNPAEVPIPKTSNVEGKEKKEYGGKTMKKAMTILKAVKILNDAIAKKYGTNTKDTDPAELNPVWEGEGGAPDKTENDISPREMQSVIDEIENAINSLEHNIQELQSSGKMSGDIASEVNQHHQTLSSYIQDLKESTMGAAASPPQQP